MLSLIPSHNRNDLDVQGTAISPIILALKLLPLMHLYHRYVLLMVCATQRLARVHALKDITE